MRRYDDIAFTDEVKLRQELDGSRASYEQAARQTEPPAALGPHEQAFIRAADSFYLASVSSSGWPYIQHRGGPAGFVHLVDDVTLAWLERHGNRQYITAGNLDHDDRVALFFMDYPERARLKLHGHAERIDQPEPELVERLGGGRATGAMIVRVETLAWNCSKYITPRYTSETVRAAVQPLERRIHELEHLLARAAENGAAARPSS